ncbi:Dual-specificity RNA methyltransferase RlmN [Moorella thermoacetica]|uniref:Dual-specificity RNA methyltransferase RlmN n=1 Tax=Neomoorella thermoacetica TaxID=1525 RepID=A0AAC9HIL6_NEOTH|nr:radical SAM protein [Moorella thermoacetica]AOQ24565.1 putative dual-specificity RNA methyltransferase RlmN [Moorella thermoacetica]TYL12666.1 Dual-specificity RNA methyltransferase RlmN [Moorella thermoacetica]
MLQVVKHKSFGNGVVYHLQTPEGYPIETTDTFLPIETINAVGRKTNILPGKDFGSRADRWMIGVSVMSGCPVGCKFCATGSKFYRNLSAEEIVEQVEFIVNNNPQFNPQDSKEFKILFTRMGEPLLNIDNFCQAVQELHDRYPFAVKAISTVGVRNPYAVQRLFYLASEIPNIQFQISMHTTREDLRKELLGKVDKFSLAELADLVRTWRRIKNNKGRKVTLNFTLVKGYPLEVLILRQYFDPQDVFIKLSPLNENKYAGQNNLIGVIEEQNIL